MNVNYLFHGLWAHQHRQLCKSHRYCGGPGCAWCSGFAPWITLAEQTFFSGKTGEVLWQIQQKKDFIQVKPWKQISKCIPNPTIPSSFPLLHIYSIFVFSNFFQNQQAFSFRKQLAVSFRKPLSLNLALSDCELRRRPLSVTTQRDSTLSQRSSNSSSQGSSTVATWGKAMTFGDPPLLRVVGVATLVMDTWLFKKCLRGKGGSGIDLEILGDLATWSLCFFGDFFDPDSSILIFSPKTGNVLLESCNMFDIQHPTLQISLVPPSIWDSPHKDLQEPDDAEMADLRSPRWYLDIGGGVLCRKLWKYLLAWWSWGGGDDDDDDDDDAGHDNHHRNHHYRWRLLLLSWCIIKDTYVHHQRYICTSSMIIERRPDSPAVNRTFGTNRFRSPLRKKSSLPKLMLSR